MTALSTDNINWHFLGDVDECKKYMYKARMLIDELKVITSWVVWNQPVHKMIVGDNHSINIYLFGATVKCIIRAKANLPEDFLSKTVLIAQFKPVEAYDDGPYEFQRISDDKEQRTTDISHNSVSNQIRRSIYSYSWSTFKDDFPEEIDEQVVTLVPYNDIYNPCPTEGVGVQACNYKSLITFQSVLVATGAAESPSEAFIEEYTDDDDNIRQRLVQLVSSTFGGAADRVVVNRYTAEFNGLFPPDDHINPAGVPAFVTAETVLDYTYPGAQPGVTYSLECQIRINRDASEATFVVDIGPVDDDPVRALTFKLTGFKTTADDDIGPQYTVDKLYYDGTINILDPGNLTATGAKKSDTHVENTRNFMCEWRHGGCNGGGSWGDQTLTWNTYIRDSNIHFNNHNQFISDSSVLIGSGYDKLTGEHIVLSIIQDYIRHVIKNVDWISGGTKYTFSCSTTNQINMPCNDPEITDDYTTNDIGESTEYYTGNKSVILNDIILDKEDLTYSVTTTYNNGELHRSGGGIESVNYSLLTLVDISTQTLIVQKEIKTVIINSQDYFTRVTTIQILLLMKGEVFVLSESSSTSQRSHYEVDFSIPPNVPPYELINEYQTEVECTSEKCDGDLDLFDVCQARDFDGCVTGEPDITTTSQYDWGTYYARVAG